MLVSIYNYAAHVYACHMAGYIKDYIDTSSAQLSSSIFVRLLGEDQSVFRFTAGGKMICSIAIRFRRRRL